MEMIDVQTKNKITVKDPSLSRNLVYPSEWFAKNPDKKPTIKLMVNSKSYQLKNLRSFAVSFIQGENVPPFLTLQYIYEVMKTMTETLDVDWKSYKITVKAGNCTPLSFINVELQTTEKTHEVTSTGGVDDNQQTDIYLLTMIMGLYRYSRTHERHKVVVAKRVTAMITPMLPNVSFPSDLSSHHANENQLKDNIPFDFLASAIDIFLHRFPASPFAKARIGTIILRFQGCSGLGDITYLKSLLGKEKMMEAIPWIFSGVGSREIAQMFGPKAEGDELHVEHSYFPYLSGLILSERSPYAAGSVVALHLTVHIVGSIMGNPRSKNAVMLEYSALNDISCNAAIIVLAHHATVGLNVRYLSAEQAQILIEKEQRAKDNIQDSGEEQPLRNGDLKGPVAWLSAMKDNNFKFSQAEKEILSSAIEEIRDPRLGSVGEWVKSHFMISINFD